MGADKEVKKSSSSKVLILLFERDKDTAKIIQNSLTSQIFLIDTVVNAFSGMKLIKSSPPDFIIANYEFPDMTGTDLIKKVKALNCVAPIILYGPRNEENILNAFRNGASDYWAKPLFSKEMKARLEHIYTEWRDKREKSAVKDGQDQKTGVKTPESPEKEEKKKGKEASGKNKKDGGEKTPEEHKAKTKKDDAPKKDQEEIKAAIERERRELQGLLKITSSLNVSGDTKVSLNHLTDLAAEIMNCEAASIMLVNKRENLLEFVVASGEKKFRLETIKVPMGEGVAGWVAIHGKAQIVNDTTADKRFTGVVDEESGFKTNKILAVPMKLDSEIIGVLEVINTRDNRDFSDDDVRIIDDMADRIATVIAATRKIEDQQNFFIQTTNILVKAIEKKDMYAEGHEWKVAEYCHKIAAAMGMADSEKDILHFGALLHDIGKLSLPSYIFNKRILSERERELIKQHPVQGAKLLEPINVWKWVVPCVLYHHEHWDGSGYPFGREKDSIPLPARIISIAEAFSVMRSPSSYKKQMTLKESILEIMRMSGKQFDPDIVKVFISVLEKENRQY